MPACDDFKRGDGSSAMRRPVLDMMGLMPYGLLCIALSSVSAPAAAAQTAITFRQAIQMVQQRKWGGLWLQTLVYGLMAAYLMGRRRGVAEGGGHP
jgi:hypothetical protein